MKKIVIYIFKSNNPSIQAVEREYSHQIVVKSVSEEKRERRGLEVYQGVTEETIVTQDQP